MIEINKKSLKLLQNNIYNDIPLTKDLAIELRDIQSATLITFAPLSKNINDKGSVFGGSSAASMIISGWCLIKLYCDRYDIQSDIVIHRNETKWIKASYEDLEIETRFDIEYDFKKIKNKLSNGKHQRINCTMKIFDQNKDSYTDMSASFVILPQNYSS